MLPFNSPNDAVRFPWKQVLFVVLTVCQIKHEECPFTVAVVALIISKSVARMPCYSHRSWSSFHNARCLTFICYCIFIVTGVVLFALQMNELKLHAVEQDTIIAALTASLFRACSSYQDIAVPVERSQSSQTTVPSVSIVQVLEVFRSPNQQAVAGVWLQCFLVCKAMVRPMKVISRTSRGYPAILTEIPGSEVHREQSTGGLAGIEAAGQESDGARDRRVFKVHRGRRGLLGQSLACKAIVLQEKTAAMVLQERTAAMKHGQTGASRTRRQDGATGQTGASGQDGMDGATGQQALQDKTVRMVC
jgi:hypothetical protein